MLYILQSVIYSSLYISKMLYNAKCYVCFNAIYGILYISKMLYVANFENAIYGSQMLNVWLYDARTLEKEYSQCEIVN